jgi:hypothetical protein
MFTKGSRIGRSRGIALAIGWARLAAILDTGLDAFMAGERADHRASYVAATLQVRPWFDGFVKPTAH